MKKFFSVALSAMLLLGAFTCLAQGKPDKKEWQEKMKAEKVAYLTDYMTSAEAQKFWPVYNQAESEKMEGFKNTMDAFKALETAIDEKKSDSEVQKALDNYLSAQQKGSEIDKKYSEKYRVVRGNNLSSGRRARRCASLSRPGAQVLLQQALSRLS